MVSFTVEFWLILQVVVEVLLCSTVIYYFYREKHKKDDNTLEKERLKTLLGSLHRLITEAEDLDKGHQKVLKLWEKIDKRGKAIEEYIDHYERKLRSFPKGHKPEEDYGGIEPDVTCYEKASRLVEKGCSAEEIAHKVGLPRGEVDLIMNLKRQ